MVRDTISPDLIIMVSELRGIDQREVISVIFDIQRMTKFTMVKRCVAKVEMR